MQATWRMWMLVKRAHDKTRLSKTFSSHILATTLLGLRSSRHLLAHLIAKDLQPYSVVESDSFCEMINTLEPSYKMQS